MRSSNPTLSDRVFSSNRGLAVSSEIMTVDGTINKTFLLFLLALMPAGYVWEQFYSQGGVEAISGYLYGGLFGGFILAMIISFKADWAPFLAPVYAILEGLFLGGVSAFFESMYGGIVIQAVGLTFGTMFIMLILYRTRVIRVTDKLRSIVMAATGGIALMYLATMLLDMFGVTVPFIHSGGPIGIGISLVIVGVAAFNLLLDFDFIEQSSRNGAPKFLEWYGAFGLMVTLVWLYLEMLRLLSKLRD